MGWKTAHRSFYYHNAPEPEDLVLRAEETALLCIDVQNYGMEPAADPIARLRAFVFLVALPYSPV